MSAMTENSAIRPFTIDTPEAELQALRQRIEATRWPDRETVLDHSRACSSPRFKSSRGTGRRTTTGVGVNGG